MDPSQSSDLTPYRLDLAIVRETAERVISDFDFFGINIEFSGNEAIAYEELMSQLVPVVRDLLRSSKPKLMQVLYRIDISERILASSSRSNPSLPLPEIISRLVIEREMQKVITRKIYKNKK